MGTLKKFLCSLVHCIYIHIYVYETQLFGTNPNLDIKNIIMGCQTPNFGSRRFQFINYKWTVLNYATTKLLMWWNKLCVGSEV